MTLCHWLEKMTDRPQDSVAIKYRRKSWKEVTWSEYKEKIDAVSSALLGLGHKPGDKVAIFASTRYEWAVADLGILGAQGITVPVYHTLTEEELTHVLTHAEAKYIFVENASLLRLLRRVTKKVSSLERIIVFDQAGEIDNDLITFSDFLKSGDEKIAEHRAEIAKRRNATKLETPATILYTSGTTGKPRGVLLTHAQIVSEVTEAFPLCGVQPSDVSLSFLPYSHILGRIEMWGHLYVGFTLAFAESIERVRDNLEKVKPTILVAVPRIFEKIYGGISAKIESGQTQKKIFGWALGIGRQASQYRIQRKALPLLLVPQFELADRLILRQIRQAFGGRLRFAICGGAPMNREIGLFFHACGIQLLEGYGLTETTGAICVNTPHDYQFGTVGQPIGDVQIKFAADGEILVKSSKVMKEYYHDAEATKAVFTDGWFHTGDIGEFEEGKLKITDRKKDLIKTAGGKYVAPQKLEGLLRTHGLISNAHIHGDQRKYVVALLTLDAAQLAQLAELKDIKVEEDEELFTHPVVDQAVREIVAEANAHLASFESIKKFKILPKDFTVESGELTPSLKVKRKVVDTRYKEQIDELYK